MVQNHSKLRNIQNYSCRLTWSTCGHGSKSLFLQVDRWLRSMDMDEKGFLTEENFEEGVRRTFFIFFKNFL